jgi:hypothetical protein
MNGTSNATATKLLSAGERSHKFPFKHNKRIVYCTWRRDRTEAGKDRYPPVTLVSLAAGVGRKFRKGSQGYHRSHKLWPVPCISRPSTG